MKSRLFVSVSAAPGNVGDIFIRRQALVLSANSSAVLAVYTGKMPRDYIDSLNIPKNAWVTGSAIRYVLQICVALILSKRSMFVVSPGPAFLGKSVPSRIKHLLLCALFAAVRIRGWTSLVLGRSIVGGNRLDLSVERLIAKFSSLYAARDVATVRRVGNHAEMVPDLAFTETRSPVERPRRRLLAVSVRHDRDLPEWFFDKVESLARSQGLEIAVVTQVREDDERNACVAQRLVAKHIPWAPEVSAAEQERRLFEVYDDSAVCVSDRLHVIALALLSGAAPVIYRSSGDSKIVDALGPFFDLEELPFAVASASEILSRQAGEQRAAAVRHAHDCVGALAVRIAELARRY